MKQKSIIYKYFTPQAVAIVCAAFLLLMLCLEGFAAGWPDPTTPPETTVHTPATSPADTAAPTETTLPAETTQPPTSAPTQPPAPLVITAPESDQIAVTSSLYTITGTADPKDPPAINGTYVTMNADGSFAAEVTLEPGDNRFVLDYKGQSVEYRIHYRYIILSECNPGGDQSYGSGAQMPVSVVAREGSTVTASFNGKTITLTQKNITGDVPDNSGAKLATFTGTFSLPANNVTDQNLGTVTFSASHNGLTETAGSGSITCLKDSTVKDSDPSVTPQGGEYVDVGSGYIAEVVYFTAETFNINTTNDQSSPLYNYLPEGTVDYCDTELITNSGNGYKFVKLRCGRKVLLTRQDSPSTGTITVVKQYIGTLPDHNELSVASVENVGQHTVITLDTMWKAPFLFTLAPQSYNNPSIRDWTVSTVTATYVDITFCYATVFEGEVSFGEDNPIFSGAEIIRGEADTTLRLHLKKTGGFYGWEAKYNDAGQLCFYFLNPAKATAADNAYGADLTGVEILIDVGHGGKDGGAVGSDGKTVEAERNLNLAEVLKAELESMGATVIMNRTGNTLMTADERIKHLQEVMPDFCIAIHHNSNSVASAQGFIAYHFDAFSSEAAKFINRRTAESGVYQSTELAWHYYYLTKQSACPGVLTENGYLSNADDLAGITDEQTNLKKAQAIAQGIADYFLSIQ